MEALETEFSGLAKEFIMTTWKTVCRKGGLNIIQKLLTVAIRIFLLLLMGDGIKLEACQSSSINPLTFCRQKISHDFEVKLTNDWATFFFLSHCKKKAGKQFCCFIKPAWFIYWKCIICHLCLATLLFIKKSVDSMASVYGNLIALVLSAGPVNSWHCFTQHNAVRIYITDVFI